MSPLAQADVSRCLSDSTLLRSIGQYRAQGKDKAGKVIQLVQ